MPNKKEVSWEQFQALQQLTAPQNLSQFSKLPAQISILLNLIIFFSLYLHISRRSDVNKKTLISFFTTTISGRLASITWSVYKFRSQQIFTFSFSTVASAR